ncbi:MAG: hypothetical protein AB1374_13060 [Bacillota bacterium]
MKLLHIFRSPPTPEVRKLAAVLSGGNEAVEFHLYQDGVDYDCLVALLFSCDKVISWW